MNKLFSFLFFAILMMTTGCFSLKSSNTQRQHELDLSIHRIRNELDDIKHDLNNYEIEHHVLEGKLSDQENSLSALKERNLHTQQKEIEELKELSHLIEKKFHKLAKEFETIHEQVKKLSEHANDTTTALSQYKDKISFVEDQMSSQGQQLAEMKILKESFQELLTELRKEQKAPAPTTAYTVQKGDTLEQIALKFHTTPKTLRQLNHLSNDLIKTGDAILVPAQEE